jgi:hypothetical protein
MVVARAGPNWEGFLALPRTCGATLNAFRTAPTPNGRGSGWKAISAAPVKGG